MALANIGFLLAQWKYKVLVIDWDLEAPGLENYYKDLFNVEEVKDRYGLIDLLNLKVNNDETLVENINWKEFINVIHINNIPNLHFISAGKRDNEYGNRVREFNYTSFYEEHDGGQYIEDLREFWLSNYDFILIDSRTGLTDSSGICSIHMPDILVLLFTPNEQSFNGVIDVSRKAIEGQKNIIYDRFKLRTLPIPCRIENAETPLLDEWMLRISDGSIEMLEWLPKDMESNEYLIQPLHFINRIKIPYKTYYAYGEKLAANERGTVDPLDLGYVYETIAGILANDLQNTELLVNRRDDLIRKAKGEQIEDELKFSGGSHLLKEVKQKEKENLHLQEQLKIKEEERQKSEREIEVFVKQKHKVRGVVLVAFFVLIVSVASFYIYYNLPSTKKERYYLGFKDNLSKLYVNSTYLTDSLCVMADYKNEYNDNRITRQTDSLRIICKKLKYYDSLIVVNTNIIRQLENKAPITTKARGEEVNKIQKEINFINENADVSRDSNYAEIEKLEVKADNIINKDPILAKGVQASLQVERSIKSQDSLQASITKLSGERNKLVLFSKSGWFKEGYILRFENIRLTLDELNVEEQQVRIIVCEQDDNKPCRNPIDTINIKVNKSLEFPYAGKNYSIQLNRISRAGKNPFKLAAFISFKKF